MKVRNTLFLLPILVWGGLQAQDKIEVNASVVKNTIPPTMYGSCIEDVNHEIYGGLYDQKIFGESFEEPAKSPSHNNFTTLGGYWTAIENGVNVKPDGGAKLVYDLVSMSKGSVEAMINFPLNGGGNAALLVNVSEEGIGADNFVGYEIGLNRDGQKVILGRHRHNFELLADAKVNTNTSTDKWNKLRVAVNGANIKVYLNDQATPVIDYTDTKTPIISGKVALRTWNSDINYRDIKINGRKIAFKTDNANDVSRMWTPIIIAGKAKFNIIEGGAFHGKQAQSIDVSSKKGIAGIANSSLNGWGIATQNNALMQGSLFLRADQIEGKVRVELQSADGSKIYASTPIAIKAGDWTKYSFSLTPNQTDAKARLAIILEGAGKIDVDMVRLHSTGDKLFHGLPCRADIGQAMVNEGLTFLRYGGTMVNTPEYRFKKMIGDPDRRPPYRGHWYTYSTNGFGIEDFVKFAEAAGFPYSFAVNIDETPEDMADMIEYFKGDVTTEWGAKRAANGHPEPYKLIYVEIGNEEVLFNGDVSEEYDYYINRFNLLADAMRSVDPSIKLICSAWWRPESPNVERVFRALDGKADYWDYHPWCDDPASGLQIDKELTQMRELFNKWNPNTTMKCALFEENGNLHNMQRALGHSTAMNACRRHADFMLTSCAANALQPMGQNDNGWDQGQVFFTPDQVWGMPPYYATQMASKTHMPLRVESVTTGDLDVTATRSNNDNTLILHVVNIKGDSRLADIAITGFEPASKVEVTTLSAPLKLANTPAEPEKVKQQVSSTQIKGETMKHTFPAYSYTILKYTR